MEFVMEILMEVYIELMMLIVPDMGNTKRKKIIAGSCSRGSLITKNQSAPTVQSNAACVRK